MSVKVPNVGSGKVVAALVAHIATTKTRRPALPWRGIGTAELVFASEEEAKVRLCIGETCTDVSTVLEDFGLVEDNEEPKHRLATYSDVVVFWSRVERRVLIYRVDIEAIKQLFRLVKQRRQSEQRPSREKDRERRELGKMYRRYMGLALGLVAEAAAYAEAKLRLEEAGIELIARRVRDRSKIVEDGGIYRIEVKIFKDGHLTRQFDLDVPVTLTSKDNDPEEVKYRHVGKLIKFYLFGTYITKIVDTDKRRYIVDIRRRDLRLIANTLLHMTQGRGFIVPKLDADDLLPLVRGHDGTYIKIADVVFDKEHIVKKLAESTPGTVMLLALLGKALAEKNKNLTKLAKKKLTEPAVAVDKAGSLSSIKLYIITGIVQAMSFGIPTTIVKEGENIVAYPWYLNKEKEVKIKKDENGLLITIRHRMSGGKTRAHKIRIEPLVPERAEPKFVVLTKDLLVQTIRRLYSEASFRPEIIVDNPDSYLVLPHVTKIEDLGGAYELELKYFAIDKKKLTEALEKAVDLLCR